MRVCVRAKKRERATKTRRGGNILAAPLLVAQLLVKNTIDNVCFAFAAIQQRNMMMVPLYFPYFVPLPTCACEECRTPGAETYAQPAPQFVTQPALTQITQGGDVETELERLQAQVRSLKAENQSLLAESFRSKQWHRERQLLRKELEKKEDAIADLRMENFGYQRQAQHEKKKREQMSEELLELKTTQTFTCCVCWEDMDKTRPRSVCLPCGHRATCSDCSATMIECPMCRSQGRFYTPLFDDM